MAGLVSVVLIVLLATTACGSTYYVDTARPAADDTNSGAQVAPWKTIGHAAAQLKPGTYDERVTVSVSGREARHPTSALTK